MTCHNRRNKTLACLDALANQTPMTDTRIQVYLVDDGCTDGTAEAVRARHAQTTVLPGDGTLYWCGGMRKAFAEAMKSDYDYYLWLNDDTVLYPDAVVLLLGTSRDVQRAGGRQDIVVGTVCDPVTGRRTYGGIRRFGRRPSLGFLPVEPRDEAQRCETMNGNCVLIPRTVVQKVGNLSPEFTHWLGDLDYGLRAGRAGFSCWVVSGYVGTCGQNTEGTPWANPHVPFRERLRILHTPKGLPPWEWAVFCRRHQRIFWPLSLAKLYARCCFPDLWAPVAG